MKRAKLHRYLVDILVEIPGLAESLDRLQRYLSSLVISLLTIIFHTSSLFETSATDLEPVQHV